MGSLTSALQSAASALRIYQRALTVVENNVTNVGTAGFAKQQLLLAANGFDSQQQLPGGVTADGLIDYRDSYVEHAVWDQSQAWGYSDQRTTDLKSIEPTFQVTDGSGISAALDSFFQSFSALSTAPNDTTARRVVLDNANKLAAEINSASNGLGGAQLSTDRQIRDAVSQINSIGEQLQALSIERRQGAAGSDNTGADAKMYSLLQDLAELSDATVLEQDDGTMSIFLGGQTLFIIGDQFHPIQSDISGASAEILDAAGNLITGQFTGGRIAALLDTRNTLIPDYREQLNTLAQSLSDTVNQTLANGVDANGQMPVQDLFSYDATVGAAQTLKVNDLDPSELAAALADAPGGNGNALELAALGNTPKVDGYTFSEYYGTIAAKVGRDLSAASTNLDARTASLAQVKAWRESVSGVNLDEEAVRMTELQRSYQAVAELLTILNQMTQVVLDILQ